MSGPEIDRRWDVPRVGFPVFLEEKGKPGGPFSGGNPFSEIHCFQRRMNGVQAVVERRTEKKRVLVVDDEASVLDLVRMALEREGYVVETASTGDAALSMIENDIFDAVISDLKMPGKNGIDLYEHCVENEPDLSTRFLILT